MALSPTGHDVKPYFAADGVTIYHGDARDILPAMPKESADLLVTDPPYGQGWQSGHRAIAFDAIKGDHSQEIGMAVLAAAMPCLRRFRHMYVFGRFDFGALPVGTQVELIWDKMIQNSGDLALPWGNQHEYIQFAVKVGSAVRVAAGGGRLAARLRKGSVLRHPRPNADAVTRHPTEKPVELLRELIESSSCIGETVLDPFAGVGSTLVAARIEGRKAIGIELEEKYCEVAARRLDQGVLDLGAA